MPKLRISPPRRLLAGALSALLLAGCSGGAPVGPAVARAPATLSPTIEVDASKARLDVGFRILRPPAALRTQSVPITFDHAVARLNGPLVGVSAREVTVTLPGFSPNQAAATTLAGDGVAGYAEGTGADARFNSPNGVAVAADGTIYVADDGGHRIRKVTPAGAVTTMAGDGTAGDSDTGDGDPGRFFNPTGVALDRDGNLYVADFFNNAIRKVDPGNGAISTIAGKNGPGLRDGGGDAQFLGPRKLVVDGRGDIFVTDRDNQRIRKINRNGVVSTLAGGGPTGVEQGGYADGTGGDARFSQPTGIALDREGNVFVSEEYNHDIRKITPAGVVTTFAGGGPANPGLVDATGTAARFTNPGELAFDQLGNLYVADQGNRAIRMVTPLGVVTTIAGGTDGYQDGTGADIRFAGPVGLAVTPDHGLVVVDLDNQRLRRVAFPATTATAVFANLRPGDGYQLTVNLYDKPGAGQLVTAGGQTTSPFALGAGVNSQTVILKVSEAITQPLPYPVAISQTYGNNAFNAPGKPDGVVVVLGDTLRLRPGVSDPNSQLREVRLYLDGTPAANYTDGQLMAKWSPQGFSQALAWNTGQALDPVLVTGINAVGFRIKRPAPTGSAIVPLTGVPPVPAPSAVASEGTPNHTLTFTLHDRFAPAARDLIRAQSYPLTVVNPGAIDFGFDVVPLPNAPVAFPTPLPSAEIPATGTVLGSFPTGAGPYYLAVDADSQPLVGLINEGNVGWYSTIGQALSTFSPDGTPKGIAVDANGNIWVAVIDADKLLKFSATGSLLATASNICSGPYDVAVDDANDRVWVSCSGDDTIHAVNRAAGSPQAFSLGAGDAPRGIAVLSDGTPVVACTGSARVVFVDPLQGTVTPVALAGSVPEDVAVDSQDQAWVADGATNYVQIVNTGGFITRYPAQGTSVAIARDGAGDMWISQESLGKVRKLNGTDGSIRATAVIGASPRGIAVAPDGAIWVAVTGENRLVKLQP